MNSTKLDDIVICCGISTEGMANIKQEIKDLFLEIIGDDEQWSLHWTRKQVRAELRKKVEKL